jgi:hypothetical protein
MIFEHQQELLFFFILAIFNSLLIIGLYNSSMYDYCHPDDCLDHVESCDDKCIDKYSKMILWRLRYYSVKILGEFWSKPIITCPKCMASFHSIYIYWMVVDFNLFTLISYPLYVLFLSGMVTIICSIITKK